MRKKLIKLLLRGDRKMLSDLVIEHTSFLSDIDFEDFERNSGEMWSRISASHRDLNKWISQRMTILLKQGLIDSANRDGLKAVAMEWELIKSLILAPIEMIDIPRREETGPQLRTKEEIMAAWKKKNGSDMV